MITIKQFLKIIDGVFVLPNKHFYLGKIRYYTPYFYPMNFNDTILSIRRLKVTPEDQYQERIKDKPWLKERAKFTNLPMVRRSKDWIVKVFGRHYWIEVGWPFKVITLYLGWKDKYDSPRFEWSPGFQIWFFRWQFDYHLTAPNNNDETYWEMILWYLYYSGEDIDKAKETWEWVDSDTKQSTWNDNYLIKKDNETDRKNTDVSTEDKLV